MFGKLSGHGFFGGSSGISIAEYATSGVCGTNNPSYQTAVPSSSDYGTSSSKVDSSYQPTSQSTDWYSSSYHISSSYSSNSHKKSSKSVYFDQAKSNATSYNTSKWLDHDSEDEYSLATNNYGHPNTSLTLKKPRSYSITSHSNYYPNPNFIELLPVSTQFEDPEQLPMSMKNMSISDQVVNFYPVHKKGPNYLKYCIGWLSDVEKPSSMTDCIWKYTSGPNWYCTEVNMALASDSPKLKSYGPYIKQLKYSIGMSPMNFSGIVFRGADMSPSEIRAYETKNIFLIPSFTSTSKSMPFKDKNTLFHIDITPEWSTFCMEIQPKHTKYPGEEEILFSCYNLYEYQRTEKSNGQRIIKLTLLNYNQYFDYQTNTILNYYG